MTDPASHSQRGDTDGSGVDVSVIIPVYNDYDALEDCLEALRAQTYPDDDYEIVVVDNDSDPAQFRDVASPADQIRQFHQPHPGSYAARNLGIARARGDMLAFTDADCRPVDKWLERGVDAIRRHDNIGFVGGDIEVYPDDPADMTAVEKFEVRHAFHPKSDIENENYTVTANLLTPRSVVESVGTFNGSLMSGGDRQWCRRVVASGYEALYVPDVCVRHPARRNWSELLGRTRRIAQGWHRDEAEGGTAVDLAVTLRRFADHLCRAAELTGETFYDPELELLEKCQIAGVAYAQGLAHYAARARLLVDE